MRFLVALAFGFCFLPVVASAQSWDDEGWHVLVESGGYPDWSPDGQFIVYSTLGSQTMEGDLMLIPVAGGEPLQLTHGGGHHGVFSPDGKSIVFDAAKGTQVQVIPATGGAQVRIVPAAVPIENSGNPCWSPDGTQIAFRSQFDLCTLDLATGDLTTLSSRENLAPLPLGWLASENSLIVALRSTVAKKADLWKIPLDGGAPVQLTNGCLVTQGSITRDEKYIVYSASKDGEDWDLWVIWTAGGEPLQLTSGGALDMEPCWSPDGRRIILRSISQQQDALWLMDVELAWVEQQLQELNGQSQPAA